MPQIHLHAEVGDYAPLVLLPGDPNRATRIAASFDGGLERARMVNDNRALYGYTGTWKGHPVSVQTTGMGTPSFSIGRIPIASTSRSRRRARSAPTTAARRGRRSIAGLSRPICPR